MSSFSVPVVRIKAIEPIYGSDAIELAVVGDYRSVVQKGLHKVGGLAVYIPEQAILPAYLIEVMGLTGRLAGSDKNRVKAIKLRGQLSQGLLYPISPEGVLIITSPGIDGSPDRAASFTVKEGEDLADQLGITKYVVPVPEHLAGEVYAAGQHLTVPYDIENIKKFNEVFQDGEEVVMTEKLHGTFCGVGILPRGDWEEKHFMDRFVIFSKGLGGQGLCFKASESNMDNTYVKTLIELGVLTKLSDLQANMEEEGAFDRPMFLLGEIFGAGIQDLTYGVPRQYRLFDVCVGYRGDQHYFSYEARKHLAEHLGLPMVPVLYKGPFSKEVLDQYTNGKETISGKNEHVREGVVVTPVEERYEDNLGRVILKSVSGDYLTRKTKNGQEATEYN